MGHAFVGRAFVEGYVLVVIGDGARGGERVRRCVRRRLALEVDLLMVRKGDDGAH